MKKTITVCAVAAVSAGAVLTTAGPALAGTVDCTTLTNVVYIAGSSASKPLLISLAKSLGSSVSILYAAPASCAGLADVTAPQTESASFTYLAPDGSANTCTGAGGATFGAVNIDVGVADVYPASCITPTITLTATQKTFDGPIQPMEIVVPWGSSESSISADAAYTVFGFAAEAQYTVMPWNDPTAIWTRGPTSGTQVMISNAINLSAAKWLSTLTGDAGAAQIASGSGAMLTDIVNANATKPNQTIGILSAGTADPARSAPGTNDAGAATGGIKPLAFQAIGQDCGYYPDSDLSHFDKINVRQGSYAIWGPIHFVTNVDGSGNPIATTLTNPVASSSTAVATLINAVTHNGLSTTDLQTEIKAETAAAFVPECAMQVKRTGEVGHDPNTPSGGDMSYQPTNACGCYFESLTGGGTTVSSYCQTCTADADCADAGAFTHCNFGYCEAK